MLEQQQHQLVAGLREMYRKLQAGEGWDGSALDTSSGGHPLTHDILEHLDLLQQSPDSPMHLDHFEEEPERLQELLIRNGAARVGRRASLSPPEDSEPPSPPSHRAELARTSYSSPDSIYTPPRTATPPTQRYAKMPMANQFTEPTIFEPEQQFTIPTWLNTSQLVPSAMPMGFESWDNSMFMGNMQAYPPQMGLATPGDVSMNDFLDFSECANPSVR